MFSSIPDSMTGAILAIEGVKDAAALLNGPTGCKFYHASVAETQLPRQDSLDPVQHAEVFYFGQPRVPCTYLDGEDYVYGSEEKIQTVLPRMLEKGHRLIGIVNSPGASLIGDEIPRIVADSGVDVRHVSLESTGFTGTLVDGFQSGTLSILEEVVRVPERTIKGRVNLLGVSLFQLRWGHTVDHLRGLLNMCGLEVGSVICAGSTVEEIAGSAESEANIVVHHEYSDRLVEWYEGKFGIPSLSSDSGAPIGFDALEDWLKGVGKVTGANISPAMGVIQAQRRRCHDLISRYNSLTGLPKGCSFGVRGDASIVLPITTFLFSYLGMVPEIVECNGTSRDSAPWRRLEEFLSSHGMEDSLRGSMDEARPDIVLADGNLISSMVSSKRAGAGIAIALPSTRPMDLMSRPMLGLEGTLMLLDQVLNGLWGDQGPMI